MKILADTNWLAAVYFAQAGRSAVCHRWMEQHDFPLFISKPVGAECAAVFPRLDRNLNSRALDKLIADLGARVIVTGDTWDEIEAKGRELLGRYAAKAEIGAMDSLIVASALLAKCGWFYSFDTGSNCRALAAVCKLKVFPELTPEDKRRIAVLRS